MIKDPGTEAGMPVIEHLISLGINVNVTLLFSRSMYMKAAKAYINGLNKLPAKKISKSAYKWLPSFEYKDIFF